MKTYKNVTGINREDLNYSSLLEAVKEQLEDSYPDLSGESLTIVADLMCRYDEDVTESNGKFSCYSAEILSTEDKFKPGDWVVGWHHHGLEFKRSAWQIGKIKDGYVYVKDQFYETGINDIRKATPEEIEIALSKIITR